MQHPALVSGPQTFQSSHHTRCRLAAQCFPSRRASHLHTQSTEGLLVDELPLRADLCKGSQAIDLQRKVAGDKSRRRLVQLDQRTVPTAAGKDLVVLQNTCNCKHWSLF